MPQAVITIQILHGSLSHVGHSLRCKACQTRPHYTRGTKFHKQSMCIIQMIGWGKILQMLILREEVIFGKTEVSFSIVILVFG